MRTAISLLLALAAAAGLLAAGEPPAGGLAPGDKAPGMYLRTMDDQEFYLSDYCGAPRNARSRQERNPVVLSFFATWCKPCKEEIPVLHQLYTKYAEHGVKVFLVDVEEGRDSVAECVFDRVYTLPVLLDMNGAVSKKYKVREMPTLVIIGRDGLVQYHHAGYKPGDETALDARIAAAAGLKEPGLKTGKVPEKKTEEKSNTPRTKKAGKSAKGQR